MLNKFFLLNLFIICNSLAEQPNKQNMSLSKKILIGGTVVVCVGSAAIIAAPAILPVCSTLAIKAAAISAATKATAISIATKTTSIAVAATIPTSTDSVAVILGKVVLDIGIAEDVYERAEQVKELYYPSEGKKVSELEKSSEQKGSLSNRIKIACPLK